MFDNLRTTLLITLSILVVVILARRYKQYVQRKHGPAPRHFELVAVEVMYHPVQLRVQVSMPAAGEIAPALLSEHHAPVHAWDPVRVQQGEQVLELPLAESADGVFYLELVSATQRMERRFIVRRA
jgi:hypothetical protein